MTDQPAPIWGIVGAGFGDMWASLHWCLRLSEAAGSPVHVSTWCGTGPYTAQRPRLIEMLALIDAPVSVLLVDERPTKPIGYDCWTVRYYPSTERWQADRCIDGVVSYQFDGRSSAEVKNPPRADVERFGAWAEAGGINLLRCGQPFSMRDCARFMAMSEVFVGCCSGMSVLAVSVGVPVHVVAYRMGVAYWYGPNRHVVCADIEGFIREYDDDAGFVGGTDLCGTWRLASGCDVLIRPGGGATWSDATHSLSGIWRRSVPNEVVWENGFVYVFTAVGNGRARIDERSPSGNVSTCLATRRATP